VNAGFKTVIFEMSLAFETLLKYRGAYYFLGHPHKWKFDAPKRAVWGLFH
jgi:hypothetical protein